MNTSIDSGPNSSVLDTDGGPTECGHGIHDSRFTSGEAKDETKDCATEEREDHGLIGFDIPCRPFEPPQNNAERMGLGMGGGNPSSPTQEEARRAGTEDDESLSSQWSEERAVNVAIIVEGRPEGAHPEENSSIGNSHLCNIADSPREQKVDQKQDASLQSKEVEKEGNDSEDERMMESLKGFYKRRGSYVANIWHRRTYKVGTYELRTDAALAYDEISKALKGPARSKLNFSTKSDHIRMREREMKSIGLRVDLEETLAMISAKVERVISSLGAP